MSDNEINISQEEVETTQTPHAEQVHVSENLENQDEGITENNDINIIPDNEQVGEDEHHSKEESFGGDVLEDSHHSNDSDELDISVDSFDLPDNIQKTDHQEIQDEGGEIDLEDEEDRSEDEEDESGEENEGEVACDICEEVIDPSTQGRYSCHPCAFDCCLKCFMEKGETVDHTHKLEFVESEMIAESDSLFQVKDPKTGNTVFLGKYQAALPGSKVFEKHQIQSVLSLMELFKTENKLNEIYKIHQKHQNSTTTALNKVVYHLIQMPDTTSPESLGRFYKMRYVLEEATCWIDQALAYGNVLVHCEKGQRRSPTILLAWMLTKGFQLKESMKWIDAEYTDKEHMWLDRYKKTRGPWIEALIHWAATYADRQKRWMAQRRINPLEVWDLIFKHHCSPSAQGPSLDSDSLKKRKVEVE